VDLTMGLVREERRPTRQTRASGAWTVLLTAAVLAFACPTAAFAQAPPPEETYYLARSGLFIPFTADQGVRRIREIRLYISEDQGNTWTPGPSALPSDGGFKYQVQHDGTYWFTVQTIDVDGRAYPAQITRGVPPGVKVVVDTQPPVITLQATATSDGFVNAEWQIRDVNLKQFVDPSQTQPVLAQDTFRLDYRIPGGNWVPLVVQPATPVGNYTWNPRTTGAVEVRLQVQDRAGNWGERITTSTASSAGTYPSASEPSGNREIKFVNTQQIKLAYDIQDVGKSGIKHVEVYRTRDGGRSWQKDEHPYPISPRPPFDPITVNLGSDEGSLGLTLVARSNVDNGEPPPKQGDTPQVVLEVDRTRPEVHVRGVTVGKDTQGTKLTITYQASDKNLGRQPIMLYYSENPEAPERDWKLISPTPIENSGAYTWLMPNDIHYELYIRVEAMDKAGNKGSDISKKVIVDLAQPKVIFRDVQPVLK
jgi:hypothetical protein